MAIENFKVFGKGSVKECLELCLNEEYIPLNSQGISELMNNETIHKYSKYLSGTVKIGNLLRDATIDELSNIKEFYNEGGRLILIGNNFGPTYEPASLNYIGKLVGVPLTANKKNAVYKNALDLLKTPEGRIFLVDDPESARELYKILGPGLMKNRKGE